MFVNCYMCDSCGWSIVPAGKIRWSMVEFLLLCHSYNVLVFYALVIFIIFAVPIYLKVCVYVFYSFTYFMTWYCYLIEL